MHKQPHPRASSLSMVVRGRRGPPVVVVLSEAQSHCLNGDQRKCN